MDRIKILIAGIGGVGGYFGGLLAKEYQKSKSIEIYFLARGENLAKIKSDGLKVIDDEKAFIAHPKIVSDQVEDFGLVDFVLICTKTYDLEDIAKQITPCINKDTVIVPLQNGVNSRDILKKTYDVNLITQGCVYLVSRIKSPGLIVKIGKVGSLFFGIDAFTDFRLNQLQNILLNAKIKSVLSDNISTVVWDKFIFLSSIATATSYFNSNVHEVLKDEFKLQSLNQLIDEITLLAGSKNIEISKNQSERIINILSSMPIETTTSMHSDFQNEKNKTELESLTGYVVNEGLLNHVELVIFKKMYTKLKLALK